MRAPSWARHLLAPACVSAAGLVAALALGVSACAARDPAGGSPAPAAPSATRASATAETPGAARGPSPVPSPGDEAAALAEMDDQWPTERYSGEAGAAKKLILDALNRHEPLGEEALAAFDPAFRGEDLAARDGESLGIHSGVSLTAWSERPAALDAAAFRSAFNRYLAEFEAIDVTEVHTWELQLAEDLPADELGLEAKEALWLVGRLPDGRLREDRLHLVFDLRRPADGGKEDWRIAGIRSEAGRTAIAEGPYFRDVTALALPGGYDQIGSQIYTDGGPVLSDFDGDRDVDLFLPREHAPARLYANDGRGRFADVTALRGLQVPALAEGSNSGVFLDYDRDGRLDLAVGLKARGLRIFHNAGDYFEDVTGPWALGGPGQWESLAVADYDQDGYPDIYATNYNHIDTEHQPESYVDARDGLPNALFRNQGGDGSFRDVTTEAGLDAGNDRWSYAAAWADYDRDGDMDLYVANDYGPSMLYRNDGGRFEEVAEEVGARNLGNGMGASWLDYDNDLDLDLYVSNMQSFAGNRITRLAHFPGTPEQKALYRRFSQGNTLLANQGDGSFEDATEQADLRAAFWAWGTVPLDYDADGDQDIYGAAGFYTGESTADT